MAYQEIKNIVVRMKQGADLAKGFVEIASLADAPGGLDGLVRVASEEEEEEVAESLWWTAAANAVRTASWSVYANCRNRLDSVSRSLTSDEVLLLGEWEMRSLVAEGNWQSLRDVIQRLREQLREPYGEHLCLSFEGVRAALEDGNRAEALRFLEASCHVDQLLTSCAAYCGLCPLLYDTLFEQGVDPATEEMRTFADMQEGIDGRRRKWSMTGPGAA